MRVTLLGTGTSTGIPVIGCTCRVCTSDDPRDQRLRCACLIETQDLTLLIDAGPDLRTQLLRAGTRKMDAVLMTHHHFDHVVGLDDLRPFFFANATPITCYAQPQTAGIMRQMFSYIFQDGSYPGVAKLQLQEVTESFEVQGRYDQPSGVRVQPIEAYHGNLPLFGYRVGGFAYLTDVSRIPESSFAHLQDLDVLVISALRHKPHRSHFTIAESLEVAARIGARQTYFTHMSHFIKHAEEEEKLPSGVSFGYDTLSFDVRDT